MSEASKRSYINWHNSFLLAATYCLIILSACSSDLPLDIKEYYYPVDQLQDGLVYQYISTNNGQDGLDHYWFFKAHDVDQAKHLTGQFYNHNRQTLQFFRQKITPSGALLDEYRLYTEDSIAQTIPVEVLYNNVYPFAIADTTAVYLYKLKFTNPQDSSINTITRNRRFGGETEWTFNEKTYPAIRMEILEQISNDLDGVLSIDLKGYEIYAKGIGLVYTERISRDGSSHMIDRLVDRVTMESFVESIASD